MSVIINGDDFGMNRRCSCAIAEAMSRGLITHTTMICTGEYFDGALRLAESGGFTDRIGVHFSLTEGVPLTADIASVRAFVSEGRFHKGYLKDPLPLSPVEKQAVRRELSAQLERLQSAGIKVLRADSHHYIHTLEYIAPLAADVCREHGVVFVRLNRTFGTPERPAVTEGRIDNAFWKAQGFKTTERFGRLSDVGRGNIPDNTEIMVHPDFDKDGVLIDRRGMENGFPIGYPLPDFRKDDAKLKGYAEL